MLGQQCIVHTLHIHTQKYTHTHIYTRAHTHTYARALAHTHIYKHHPESDPIYRPIIHRTFNSPVNLVFSRFLEANESGAH